MGHYLEGRGEVDAAVAAYKRAEELDPSSPAIPAELAQLYARQDRAREAIDAAEQALKHDPNYSPAHQVLGMILAALSHSAEESAGEDASAQVDDPMRAQAIGHLEKVGPGPSGEIDDGVQLTLGRLYLSARQWPKAIKVLSQLLQQEPGWPQGIAMLARAYTLGGRNGDAIALLKESARTDPSFFSSLADAYERDRRWKDAADAYQQASSHSPSSMELKLKWAGALLNSDSKTDIAHARDLLKPIVQANPANPWSLYLLARAQRVTGDLDGSEASARRLMAVSPANVWGPHALAQVLELRRDYRKVVEDLGPLVVTEAKPTDKRRAEDQALLLTHLGFAYQELGRHADALTSFERVRALTGASAAVDAYIVQVHIAAGQLAQALTAVQGGRKAFPDDARLVRLEADVLRRQGHVDEGLAVLKRLTEKQDAGAAGPITIAEYYGSAERYSDAVQVLEDARRRWPQDLSVLFQLGAMLERGKRAPEAERVLRDVIQRDPKHAPALNYLGYMLADRGERIEESIQYIQRALAVDPHNGAYLDSLGWAYFKSNQLDLAETNLRQAADQLVRDSVVQDHFGDLLFRRGRFEEAITAWQRALAGDGESIQRAQIDRKIQDAREKSGRK
jgi:tetratricopeptide (TPR) repeat protein